MRHLVVDQTIKAAGTNYNGVERSMAEQKGQVVSVTDGGDLVTDIDVSKLGDAPRDERLSIKCDGHATVGLYASADGQPEMTLLAFENESGNVQISITGGDASGFLGIKVGAAVTVRW